MQTDKFGPWSAEQDDADAITGEWTIRDADGGLIAEVPNPYTTYEMQVAYANEADCPLEGYARLIAAATDMLEALNAQQRAENYNANCPECNGEGDWAECGPCSELFGDAIDLRTAALSRATPS